MRIGCGRNELLLKLHAMSTEDSASRALGRNVIARPSKPVWNTDEKVYRHSTQVREQLSDVVCFAFPDLGVSDVSNLAWYVVFVSVFISSVSSHLLLVPAFPLLPTLDLTVISGLSGGKWFSPCFLLPAAIVATRMLVHPMFVQ